MVLFVVAVFLKSLVSPSPEALRESVLLWLKPTPRPGTGWHPDRPTYGWVFVVVAGHSGGERGVSPHPITVAEVSETYFCHF